MLAAHCEWQGNAMPSFDQLRLRHAAAINSAGEWRGAAEGVPDPIPQGAAVATCFTVASLRFLASSSAGEQQGADEGVPNCVPRGAAVEGSTDHPSDNVNSHFHR